MRTTLSSAANAAAEKGIHVNIVGMGDPKGSPIPIQGSNNYMKDKDGNVVITKLNEADVSGDCGCRPWDVCPCRQHQFSASNALQKEIDKMNKIGTGQQGLFANMTNSFQTFAWIALIPAC